MTINTPWGESQSSQQIAPGIVFHSTASHGGFCLRADRMREIPAKLQGLNRYGGGQWFEEDCEASIVIASFPQFFTAEEVDRARLAVRHWYKVDLAA